MNIDEYSNEDCLELFKTSNSQKDFLRKIGKRNNGSGYRLIHKLAKQVGFDLNTYVTKITRNAYEQNPKHCQFCGKVLTYEQRRNKFCSHACSASFNDALRGDNFHSSETKRKISEALQKRNPNHIGPVQYIPKEKHDKCVNCGKSITTRRPHKFCSQECCNEYKLKEKIDRFINGENFVQNTSNFPPFIKRYLMQLHDYKCEKCGWGEKNPVTNNVPLSVHHIDGDCMNNRINNLELLCPNCHSLTDNFGSLNKNSSRFHRPKIKKGEIHSED